MSQLKKSLADFPSGFRNFGEDIKLTGIPRLKFLRSEWESIDFTESNVVSFLYLSYRALFCAYFLVFLTLSITSTSLPGYWPLMATNWNFLTQTIYATLSFLNVCVFWIRQKCCDNSSKPYYHENVNWFESIIWFFLNLAYSIPQFISITYWLFVFDPSTDLPVESGDEATVDKVSMGSTIGWSLTVHGVNAVLAFIDVLIVATPIRVTHFIYPVVMNGAYLLFSGLYEVAGGTYRSEDEPYIYPILNWRQSPPVGAIVTCFVATISITLFHFLFWLIQILRTSLADRCRPLRKIRCDYENSNSQIFEDSLNERKPLLEKLA